MSSMTLMISALGAVAAILATYAVLIRVRAKTAEPTARYLTLSSPLPPAEVFARLERARWTGHCRLADKDEQRRVLVLSSSVSGWGWGFFYPVFVHRDDSGSLIEIGVRPRVPVQPGLIVANNHKACVAEIEKVLVA
jgi:hypothetical protein